MWMWSRALFSALCLVPSSSLSVGVCVSVCNLSPLSLSVVSALGLWGTDCTRGKGCSYTPFSFYSSAIFLQNQKHWSPESQNTPSLLLLLLHPHLNLPLPLLPLPQTPPDPYLSSSGLWTPVCLFQSAHARVWKAQAWDVATHLQDCFNHYSNVIEIIFERSFFPQNKIIRLSRNTKALKTGRNGFSGVCYTVTMCVCLWLVVAIWLLCSTLQLTSVVY